MSDNATKMELTYKGRSITTKNKLAHVYIRGDNGLEIMFGKKLKGYETIGTTITANANSDNTWSGPHDIVGGITDEDKITAWKSEDRINSLKYRSQQEILNGVKDNYEVHLEGMKKIYDKMSFQHKEAFILKLVMDLKK